MVRGASPVSRTPLMSGWKYYLVFTVCSFTNALFFWLFLHETKGRTLEEMDHLLRTAHIIVPLAKVEKIDATTREREFAESESSESSGCSESSSLWRHRRTEETGGRRRAVADDRLPGRRPVEAAGGDVHREQGQSRNGWRVAGLVGFLFERSTAMGCGLQIRSMSKRESPVVVVVALYAEVCRIQSSSPGTTLPGYVSAPDLLAARRDLV